MILLHPLVSYALRKYIAACSDKDILSRAKIAGPLGYLLKPFEDRELYANIEVALYKARMEAKLRESEEKLRWTFDQSPLGAAVVSLSCHFQRVNTRLCHLTGYSEQKLLSLRFPDIIHPDDLDALVEKMEALTTEDISRYQRDVRFLCKSGDMALIRLSVCMMKDVLEQPLNFLLIMEDITERKKIEEDVPVVDGPQPEIQPQAQVNHKRILLLEDEEVVRDTARSMLQFLGYEVDLAWDGTEAVELYKQALESGQPFEAVIMDLIIPGGMGGEETVQKLREVDPEVKAIVSSGYTNDPVLAEFERYGFKAAITKPYKAKDLAKTLQRIARGSGSDLSR